MERRTGENVVSKLGIIGLLGVFILISLAIRIVLPWDQIFLDTGVNFSGVDAWYHMRIIDTLVANFPYITEIDPYVQYGGITRLAPFVGFDYFIAGIAWLIGLGPPSQLLVDTIGALTPAILGALIIIPVYIMGRTLFNKWAGLIAAGMIAIIPGEFLGRSLLGFTDHHIAETFLATLTMMFLVLAIKRSKFPWAHLAGLSLGLFLVTWIGAPLFVLIILSALLIPIMLDKNASYYRDISGYLFGTMSIVIVLFLSRTDYFLLALACMLSPMATYYLKKLPKKKLSIGIASGIVIIVSTIVFLIAPETVALILDKLNTFNPVGARTTTLEAQRLLFPAGQFTFSLAWGMFGIGFFLAPIALVIIFIQSLKQRSPDKMLLIIWCLTILAITISMRRFAYYYAINVAILSGYTLYLGINWIATLKIASKKRLANIGDTTIKILIIGIVLVSIIIPTISMSTRVAKNIPFLPTPEWIEALTWMRDNTSEPLYSSATYYKYLEEPFRYPYTYYGVGTWWDFGYWVTRIARRAPICNPGSDARDTMAHILLDTDEDHPLTPKYLIIDHETISTKLHGVTAYAGQDLSNYTRQVYIPQGTQWLPISVFHPMYYQTLAVRLYNLGGQAANPEEVIVARFDGNRVIGSQTFTSYSEAAQYQKDDQRIISTDPFESPVPVDPITKYKLVFSSNRALRTPHGKVIPLIKIFERTDNQWMRDIQLEQYILEKPQQHK